METIITPNNTITFTLLGCGENQYNYSSHNPGWTTKQTAKESQEGNTEKFRKLTEQR